MVEFGGLTGEPTAPLRAAGRCAEAGSGPGWGTIPVGERILAMAAEPVVLFPELGLDHAARLAVERILTGVAVSGLSPTHLIIDLNLPPDFTDVDFETLWRAVDAVAADHGVSIAGGHTGRYEGCAFPMAGAGTALAIGDAADIRSPAAGRVGDTVLVTTGTGVLAAAVLAACSGNSPADHDGSTGRAVAERFGDLDVLGAARTLANTAGVRAIDHAVDGGVLGSFARIADAAGAAVSVEREAVPTDPAVERVLSVADVESWCATSPGTLVAAVDPDREADIRAAAAGAAIDLATVGRIVDGSGVRVDGDRVARADTDQFWVAYTERRPELSRG